MANETLQTRILTGAKNVQLGDFMSPSGSTGNATQDYVSNYNPWGGVGENLGRGIRSVGDAIKNQREQAAKEAENQAESDMYREVYNIQRTPTNMMTASQKEIEIDNIVNKYSGTIDAGKIHSILSANGAQPEKTYTRMSEQKGKEQLVGMQATQNEEMAKLAVSMDPSYAAESPSTQIEAGRMIANIQSRLTSAFDHVLSLGDSSDEQTLMTRDGLLDATAEYAKQLFPRQARVALYSGQWTPNDTQSFVNELSKSLSQKINPVTGTVLSKQQADFYARSVADRLVAKTDKEREEAMKKTKEYQDAWLDVQQNLLGTSGSAADQALYIMFRKNPETLYQAFGGTNARAMLEENMKKIGATANGHTLIPGSVPNRFVSLMAENNDMPLQQADARAVMTQRQGQQQQTLETNQNLLEQLSSYQDGWLNGLPSDYAKKNIDSLKQALPADVSLNIQSLVQANLPAQEGEGWLQRAFRWINNVSVGEGTVIDEANQEQVRGVNAEAINSMLNEYSNQLRRIGMSENDVKDIVSQGISMAGVKPSNGNSRELIAKFVNAVASNALQPIVDIAKAPATIAEPTVKAVAKEEPKEVTTEEAVKAIEEKPKTIETNNGKVNMSSLYDTKEYKSLIKNLVTLVKNGNMTPEQAANEKEQAMSIMSSALSKIKDIASELVGVKTAQAEVLPAEMYTSPRELFTGPSTEKVIPYLRERGRGPMPTATKKQEAQIKKAVNESKVTKTEVNDTISTSSRVPMSFSKGNADPRQQQGKDVNIAVIELNDGRYALVDGHSGTTGAKKLFEEYGKHYGIFERKDIADAERKRVLENLYRYYHGMPSLEEEYENNK